jgi:hypothetical protein
MGHKSYISFKREDEYYKVEIQNNPEIDMIDKSLNEPIDSDDEEYIMQKIRQDYLSDSTVTIHLIGEYSSENLGWNEQRFIKRELQASLYNGVNNTRNGVLGVVLPSMINKVYSGSYRCSCGIVCNSVSINDSTVVKEFSHNYFIPQIDKCHWAEDERYGVLVDWNEFNSNPNKFIDMAFDKRINSVASKVVVYPK